jgi:hypothetical protein
VTGGSAWYDIPNYTDRIYVVTGSGTAPADLYNAANYIVFNAGVTSVGGATLINSYASRGVWEQSGIAVPAYAMSFSIFNNSGNNISPVFLYELGL